jgi:hypothetical protein
VLTETEANYMQNNPESAIKMALGGTDSGTTVVTADIVNCIPFTDGSGTSTVAELVVPSTATMYNFTGTGQWDGAKDLSVGLQNVLLKNPSGVPTGIADDETLRFDI